MRGFFEVFLLIICHVTLRRHLAPLQRLLEVDCQAEVAVLVGISESVLRVDVATVRRLLEPLQRALLVDP
jgi:hypothetical protein